MLLLVLGTAFAHSPHDVAEVLSVAADGLLTNDNEVLAWSADGGLSFTYRAAPLHDPDCVIALSSTEWVVGYSDGGLYWSDDGGLGWTAVPGPADVRACARLDQDLFVGGEGGAWTSTDGQVWGQVGDEQPWTARDVEPLEAGGLLVVTTDGEPWRYTRATGWQAYGSLGIGAGGLLTVEALSAGGAHLVAGQDGGVVVYTDDDGELWHKVAGSPEGVRTLEIEDDVWLAATGQEAVWVSRDAGKTWTLEDDGLDPVALNNGAVGEVHYKNIAMHEGVWYLSSFEGFYAKAPDGSRWRQGELDVTPRVRTVDWLDSGELILGPYGGGVTRGTPGAQDWREIGGPIAWSYPKVVLPTTGEGDEIVVSSGSALHISRDGGLTWPTVTTTYPGAMDAILLAPGYPGDPRIWAGGRDADDLAGVTWSTDRGETWEGALLPGACTQKPKALAWDADVLWAACGGDGALWWSEDDGASWTAWGELGPEIHLMRSGDPMLVATDDGIYVPTDDGFELWALEGHDVYALDRDSLGRVWVGASGEGVGRFAGGSVTWTGFPEGDLVEELAVGPDDRLAIATRTGAWFSDDGTTWARASDYDRLDDLLQHWWFDGWTTIEDHDDAMATRLQEGGPGARAELSCEAVQLRLLGEAEAGTVISVTVDGETDTVEFPVDTDVREVWARNVGEGRHTLVLEVLEGTFRSDGAERWLAQAPPLGDDTGADDSGADDTGGGDTQGSDSGGDSGPSADEERPGTVGDGGRCGCRSQAAAWLLLPLLGIRRRRRGGRVHGGAVVAVALPLVLGCAARPVLVPATDTAEPAPLPAFATLETTPDAGVLVNELMADNASVVSDSRGDFDDWVELVNTADEVVDLGGWGLSDGLDEAEWTFADGTLLDPGGHLLVWLDGEPEEGDLHASFRLAADGDDIALFEPTGALVDAWSFEALPEDVALGRFPDASAHVAPSIRITPWNRNPHDPGLELDPSSVLFPSDGIVELELTIPDEGIASLTADPTTEVEAMLQFEGACIWPVGVRVKGRWGSLRSITDKAALRVSLDSYVEGGELRGMDNLTLNNMVQDASYFHERTAYDLLRAAGAPAPRTAYVALVLNGQPKGLYLHVETHDDRFLARWFGSAEGNLYEGSYGQDVPYGGYLDLEVDQQGNDDVSDLSDLAALAAVLEQAPAEDLVDDLEAVVDVDTTLRVLAGEVLTGHWDGYFYYPNNYRLYHDPSSGKFTLLAWGMDQTFGYDGSISEASGDLAVWMLKVPSLEERWWLALWDVAQASRDLDVEADAALVKALIADEVDADPYYGYGWSTAEAYIDATVTEYRAWPEAVVGMLFPDGEPGYE